MHGIYTSTTPGDAGDVALASFIQSGMGGGVPRPEITGNDLRDFIYFTRRSTLQGSVGPMVTQPGATSPDNAPPVILSAMIARTSSTNIHVTWTTDKSTIGMVGSASDAQFGFGSFPIYTDLEPGFATSHAMDLTVPASISPLHVQITVKDMAGNYSHTVPVTIV